MKPTIECIVDGEVVPGTYEFFGKPYELEKSESDWYTAGLQAAKRLGYDPVDDAKMLSQLNGQPFVEPRPQKRTNPYTQISHILSPLGLMLYDFVTTKQYAYGADYTRREWDGARYLFNFLFPKEYMDLLD